MPTLSRRVLMIAHHFPPSRRLGLEPSAGLRALPARVRLGADRRSRPAWPGPRQPRRSACSAELPPGAASVMPHAARFEPRPRARVPAAQQPAARSPGESHAAATSRRPSAESALATSGHLKRFPDAHLGWLPFALAAARKVDYDVAYSSSGPFTSHLVGLLLKRLTGRPWVAELRDGWYRWNRAIFPDYPAWRDVLERRLEAAAMRTRRPRRAGHRSHGRRLPPPVRRPARPTTSPSSPTASTAPSSDARPTHLPVALAATAPYAARWRFEVVHSRRPVLRPQPGRVPRSRPAADRGRPRLQPGVPPDPGRHARRQRAEPKLGRHALSSRIQLRRPARARQTIAAMRAASLLLLVANTTPGAEATVPGKLFEYLAVGGPILAIAPARVARPPTSSNPDRRRPGSPRAGDPTAIACALHASAFRERHQRTAQPATCRRRTRSAGRLASIAVCWLATWRRIFDDVAHTARCCASALTAATCCASARASSTTPCTSPASSPPPTPARSSSTPTSPPRSTSSRPAVSRCASSHAPPLLWKHVGAAPGAGPRSHRRLPFADRHPAAPGAVPAGRDHPRPVRRRRAALVRPAHRPGSCAPPSAAPRTQPAPSSPSPSARAATWSSATACPPSASASSTTASTTLVFSPHAASTPKKSPAASACPRPFILCVGSLMPWRNAPRLLRAASRLRLRPAVRRSRHLGHRSDRAPGRRATAGTGRASPATSPTPTCPRCTPPRRCLPIRRCTKASASHPSKPWRVARPSWPRPPARCRKCSATLRCWSTRTTRTRSPRRSQAAADDRGDLRRRGLERAARYTWPRAAAETWQVYEQAAR